jgi:hypothetical protein
VGRYRDKNQYPVVGINRNKLYRMCQALEKHAASNLVQLRTAKNDYPFSVSPVS